MPNRLMLVICVNDDGNNLDLLVAAPDPTAAIDLWHTHYDLDTSDTPERIYEMPTVIPATAGALGWDAVGGPTEIWERP